MYTDMTYDFGHNLKGLKDLESKMYDNLSTISWAIDAFKQITGTDINWSWRKLYKKQ